MPTNGCVKLFVGINLVNDRISNPDMSNFVVADYNRIRVRPLG